jgi:hypothetical protein
VTELDSLTIHDLKAYVSNKLQAGLMSQSIVSLFKMDIFHNRKRKGKDLINVAILTFDADGTENHKGGSRHKPCHPKRQRAPLWLPCLMLVASGRAAFAFHCPAPAARGSRHKPCHPKRQRAPLWLSCLMLVASGRAAFAFLYAGRSD